MKPIKGVMSVLAGLSVAIFSLSAQADDHGPVPVGEGAMAEYTLVRKPNVGQGSTNWNEGQTQWDVYPQDTFNFLGEHSASCGGLGTMARPPVLRSQQLCDWPCAGQRGAAPRS